MPSPVGHALGGLAAGWLIGGVAPSAFRARSGEHRPAAIRAAIWFGGLGVLADADFLFGTHSTYSHSLGAIVLAGVAIWATTRGRPGAVRLAVACASAYATHVLFDWLGSDTTPPIGIMALWPFSNAFYQSHWFVFDAISRRWWLDNFWAHNLRAVTRELALLLPVAALAYYSRRTSASQERVGLSQSPVASRNGPHQT